MAILKHPRLQIQEYTEHFLRHQDFTSLELCLRLGFSQGIIPEKMTAILDDIETRGDHNLNTQIYDFIVNGIEKGDPPSYESPMMQKLTNSLNNLENHIKATKDSFLSPFAPVKSVGLASYLHYPYLRETRIFVSACENIDAAITATFKEQSAPHRNKISYSNQNLDVLKQEIASTILQTDCWNDKQRLVLAAILKNTEQKKIHGIQYDFSGFDRITSAEINLLDLLNWEKLKNPVTPLSEVISIYVYKILSSLGLTNQRDVDESRFDANTRTMIGSEEIHIDFDWVHNLIEEIGFEECPVLFEGERKYRDLGSINYGSFFKSLNQFLEKNPDFINARDYQSHLLIKCNLDWSDEGHFDGSTSSIGYVLSMFEDGMLDDRLAYATPYRLLTEDTDVATDRQDIFAEAVSACIKANYPTLAVDIFFVGLLGHIPFIDFLPNVRALAQTLLVSIDPLLTNNFWARSRIAEAGQLFSELIILNGNVQQIDILEIKNLFKERKEHYGDPSPLNITPILAPLPFSISKNAGEKLNDSSRAYLDQIQLAWNQFLGHKNSARMKELPMTSVSLQHCFHPIWLLLEYLAATHVNPRLKDKGRSFGTIMVKMHRETNIPKESPYIKMCESSGKNALFYEDEIGRIRNWSMHANKGNSESKYKEDTYEDIMKSILPAMLEFFMSL